MKAAGAALWMAVLGILVLALVEGRRLKAIHAQYEALQAQRSTLEVQLQEQLRQRRHPAVSRPGSAEKPNPISRPASDFARAPQLTWIGTDRLTDAGNASPKAAFESVLWAAEHADIDALTAMIKLNEPDHQLVESFFDQLPGASRDTYGPPEHLLALFMASDPPAAVQLYSIEPALSHNRAAAGPGAERVNVIALTRSSAGQSGLITYTFQLTEAGWQMTTPNLPTGGVRAYLAKVTKPDPTTN